MRIDGTSSAGTSPRANYQKQIACSRPREHLIPDRNHRPETGEGRKVDKLGVQARDTLSNNQSYMFVYVPWIFCDEDLSLRSLCILKKLRTA